MEQNQVLITARAGHSVRAKTQVGASTSLLGAGGQDGCMALSCVWEADVFAGRPGRQGVPGRGLASQRAHGRRGRGGQVGARWQRDKPRGLGSSTYTRAVQRKPSRCQFNTDGSVGAFQAASCT